MIPFRMEPMGFSPWGRLIDQYTKFLLYGTLADRVGGVPITNHGMESDGREVYAPASNTSGYATIDGSALSNEVLVSGYDWTLEIAFRLPSWSDMTQDIAGIFGWASYPRFDVLIRKATQSLVIGGQLDNVSGVVEGNNLFVVQWNHTTSTFDWRMNGTKTGSQVASMSARGTTSPNILWEGVTANRHGYPFRIHYIRLSNCLRLT